MSNLLYWVEPLYDDGSVRGVGEKLDTESRGQKSATVGDLKRWVSAFTLIYVKAIDTLFFYIYVIFYKMSCTRTFSTPLVWEVKTLTRRTLSLRKFEIQLMFEPSSMWTLSLG